LAHSSRRTNARRIDTDISPYRSVFLRPFVGGKEYARRTAQNGIDAVDRKWQRSRAYSEK
jgi:hypothetical protein